MKGTEDVRVRFILDIMVDNVRAVLGDKHMYVRHDDYPYPTPPGINGVVPHVLAQAAGICIAADVALGEQQKEELKRQRGLVKWAAEAPGRQFWLGIPISYPLSEEQKQWHDDGKLTLHPFQI